MLPLNAPARDDPRYVMARVSLAAALLDRSAPPAIAHG